MTPTELLADYAGLRRNLRRLGQVAAAAARRWAEHEARCELCATDENNTGDLCAEGLALFTRAEAFTHALLTLKGRMVWQ